MRGQFLVDTLNRKSHYVIIAAAECRHTYVSYPFLNAIGACLVIRLVLVYIIVYLGVRQLFEGYVCCYRKTALLLACCQAHTCYNLVGLATQFAQHSACVCRIGWLAQNVPTYYYNRVGCYQQFVVLYGVCGCLFGCYIFGYVGCGQTFWIRFVHTFQHFHLKVYAQSTKQFLASWRVACYYYLYHILQCPCNTAVQYLAGSAALLLDY